MNPPTFPDFRSFSWKDRCAYLLSSILGVILALLLSPVFLFLLVTRRPGN